MATEGKRLRFLNIVHNDEIWKDHIWRENISARHRWPNTWGYLVYEYQKMNCNLAGTKPASRPGSSMFSLYATEGLRLPVIPARNPKFPQTTTQCIGWKSTEHVSEMVKRFGEERRGKCTIYRRMKWPRDCQP